MKQLVLSILLQNLVTYVPLQRAQIVGVMLRLRVSVNTDMQYVSEDVSLQENNGTAPFHQDTVFEQTTFAFTENVKL